jgi:hypothetical protein
MTTADKARMAVTPSVNGASVIHAYQGNVMGKEADTSVLIDHLALAIESRPGSRKGVPKTPGLCSLPNRRAGGKR